MPLHGPVVLAWRSLRNICRITQLRSIDLLQYFIYRRGNHDTNIVSEIVRRRTA